MTSIHVTGPQLTMRRLGAAGLLLAVPIALGWLAWKLLRLLLLGLALAGTALPPITTGRHRRAAAPLWVWVTAITTLPVPGVAWIWVSAAGALMHAGTHARDDDAITITDAGGAPGRRWLSAREMRIAARVFAGIALAAVLGLPWPVTLAVITGAVLAGAAFWWQDVSAPPVELSAFEEKWYQRVAHPHPEVESRYPQLEGEFVEWDDQVGRGVYRLSHSDAWDVQGMDPQVELAFEQLPGTITLSADPRLPRTMLRVIASDSDVGGRLRRFDGYTLQRDGMFIVGWTKGGLPIYGRLWNAGGAVYVTIVAPPNMGKGSLLRLIVMEGAACPDLEQWGADGKLGGGMGYLRKGFRELTTTHAESADLIHGYLHAVRERAARYGEAEEDGYMVRHLDPRMNLIIDEPRWIIEYEPRVADWLREITGTSRFVGAGLVMTLHKGDAPSYGDTETRSNMITNGWLAMGPAPDSQAKNTGLQGYDFDLSTLPNAPGWFGLVGQALDAKPTGVRALWVPNNHDVKRALAEDITGTKTELDIAPIGTVQQWLTRDTVHPEIHPATLEAFARPARERAEARAAEQAAAEQAGDSGHPTQPGPAGAGEGPLPSDGWSRMQRVLRASPEGLIRIQIAEAAQLSPGHTSELLSKHRDSGHLIQTTGKKWRLAA